MQLQVEDAEIMQPLVLHQQHFFKLQTLNLTLHGCIIPSRWLYQPIALT